MSPNAGKWWCGLSANEYSCAHGVQINFGGLTPYLAYDWNWCRKACCDTPYLIICRSAGLPPFLQTYISPYSTEFHMSALCNVVMRFCFFLYFNNYIKIDIRTCEAFPNCPCNYCRTFRHQRFSSPDHSKSETYWWFLKLLIFIIFKPKTTF